jgi:hypothetical protein
MYFSLFQDVGTRGFICALVRSDPMGCIKLGIKINKVQNNICQCLFLSISFNVFLLSVSEVCVLNILGLYGL